MIRGFQWLIVFIYGIPMVLTLHSAGFCSISDNCGKKSLFGTELPCPANIAAFEPSEESRQTLLELCGADFDFDTVCCTGVQIENLRTQLKKVDPLISSCPACKQNFYNMFCNFTCSPDQSLFVEVTKTAVSTSGRRIVTELSQYIDPESAERFYDSCRNLKFSATNGYAMDLIGGGASDYRGFLKFLGDEKPMLGGSPFQMNFRYELEGETNLTLSRFVARDCDDEEFKCACSDCANSCPTLEKLKEGGQCKIGIIPCFSFYWSVMYMVVLGGFVLYCSKKDEYELELPQELQLEGTFFAPSQRILVESSSISFQQKLKNAFSVVGFYCATFPGMTILATLVVVSVLSSGLVFFELETNAIKLWVSPTDATLQQMEYFESNFGEWFRIEQIIVKRENSPLLDWDTVRWWFEKEAQLQAFGDEGDVVSLDEICFKPLGETCALESFTQYFYGDINYLSEQTWARKLADCASSPVNCLPTFQQPLKKELLFGAYTGDDVLTANAFVITVLINKNTTDVPFTQKTAKYETRLKEWLLNELTPEAEAMGLSLSFSTELSLEEELNKSTNTDVKIIVISYLAMFLYASLALGGNSFNSLVKTRFSLGLSGIVIVLLSVVSAIGFFSFMGLKSTLIIAEVIPFLVLAIGIDNIFLIVHELNKTNAEFPNLAVEHRISRTLGQIGPSCLISATVQFSTLLLATNVNMPAVKNFAWYCSGAVLFNFLLQMTVFVSLLSLDQKRLEDDRVDCLPFLKIQTDGNRSQIDIISEIENDNYDNIFSKLIGRYYAPYILDSSNKKRILFVFAAWFGISLSLLPGIQFGLDQRIALPSDSYLVDYFTDIAQYLNVGPPIFFVVEHDNITAREDQQKLCGRFSSCEQFSLNNILEQEYKRGSLSTINEPTSNWIDDFFTWLNPDLDDCCRLKKTSLESGSPEFCESYSPARSCVSCYNAHEPKYDSTMDAFPTNDEFMFYFSRWIEEPSDPCPLGGKAPYSQSIAMDDMGRITASYFRTSHSPLRTQHDFITALSNSKRIVSEISEKTGLAVFAFSPFYVFFVQYETILRLAFNLLGLALLMVWAITTVMLNSVRSASILVVTVVMILVDIGGMMCLWGVSLNAVSLVNLVICTGLAVEFCVHLTRAYTIDGHGGAGSLELESSLMNYKYDIRTTKAYNALTGIGGSVLGGISLTKLIGICVLAFTRSKIFEVYYFRMWMSLIIIASVHGLCFLPIFLSYVGDEKVVLEEEDEGVGGELMRRLYEEE